MNQFQGMSPETKLRLLRNLDRIEKLLKEVRKELERTLLEEK